MRNDALAALSIAYVVGGKFVRVNVLSGAVMADQGIIESDAYNVLRFRKALGAKDIKIFADVHVKHAVQLKERPPELEAYELLNRSLADALIVTGEATGMEADITNVRKITEKLPNPKFLLEVVLIKIIYRCILAYVMGLLLVLNSRRMKSPRTR